MASLEQEAREAVLSAIKTKAAAIEKEPFTKVSAGTAGAVLKDLAEALAWLEMPAQPH